MDYDLTIEKFRALCFSQCSFEDIVACYGKDKVESLSFDGKNAAELYKKFTAEGRIRENLKLAELASKGNFKALERLEKIRVFNRQKGEF